MQISYTLFLVKLAVICCDITLSVAVCLQQIYAERDSLMLEDIERLKGETSVREERYN